jgi:hypothetical protein
MMKAIRSDWGVVYSRNGVLSCLTCRSGCLQFALNHLFPGSCLLVLPLHWQPWRYGHQIELIGRISWGTQNRVLHFPGKDSVERWQLRVDIGNECLDEIPMNSSELLPEKQCHGSLFRYGPSSTHRHQDLWTKTSEMNRWITGLSQTVRNQVVSVRRRNQGIQSKSMTWELEGVRAMIAAPLRVFGKISRKSKFSIGNKSNTQPWTWVGSKIIYGVDRGFVW